MPSGYSVMHGSLNIPMSFTCRESASNLYNGGCLLDATRQSKNVSLLVLSEENGCFILCTTQ